MKADEIELSAPCEADFDAMPRRGAHLYCDVCARQVVDLNALTEAQARAVVAGAESCVRFSFDAYGELRHAAERRSRRRLLLGVGATVLAGVALALSDPDEAVRLAAERVRTGLTSEKPPGPPNLGEPLHDLIEVKMGGMSRGGAVGAPPRKTRRRTVRRR